MWKSDDAPRAGAPAASQPTPATRPAGPATVQPATPSGDRARVGGTPGGSIVITGELKASEDLTIEGQVDGKIELLQNVLTIGRNAKARAEIVAKSVIVLGEVVGNITASEKLDIQETGSVEGDIVSPRLAVADGATFRGRVDMNRTQGGARPAPAQTAAKPAPVPAVSATQAR